MRSDAGPESIEVFANGGSRLWSSVVDWPTLPAIGVVFPFVTNRWESNS